MYVDDTGRREACTEATSDGLVQHEPYSLFTNKMNRGVFFDEYSSFQIIQVNLSCTVIIRVCYFNECDWNTQVSVINERKDINI